MATPEYTFEDLMDSLAGLTVKQLETLNEGLIETLRLKRRLEAKKLTGQIKVGDVLRIRQNVKPKYLAGKEVRVLAFNGQKLDVELVAGPINKFRTGKLTTPATLLEL